MAGGKEGMFANFEFRILEFEIQNSLIEHKYLAIAKMALIEHRSVLH